MSAASGDIAGLMCEFYYLSPSTFTPFNKLSYGKYDVSGNSIMQDSSDYPVQIWTKFNINLNHISGWFTPQTTNNYRFHFRQNAGTSFMIRDRIAYFYINEVLQEAGNQGYVYMWPKNDSGYPMIENRSYKIDIFLRATNNTMTLYPSVYADISGALTKSGNWTVYRKYC